MIILPSVVTVIEGFLALLLPLAGGIGTVVFVGFAMLVGGIARVVAAFGAGSFGRGTLAFIGGALTLLAGAIVVVRPGTGLAFLTLMLGAYLLVMLSTFGGLALFGAVGLVLGPVIAVLFVAIVHIHGEALADVLRGAEVAQPGRGPDRVGMRASVGDPHRGIPSIMFGTL